jgi:CRP/FNR family cyclic AMP-dependent transcriptional regulator
MTKAVHEDVVASSGNSEGLENLIEGHAFLCGLRRDHRRVFHDCASVRRFASQQVIFHDGGEADHFYLITVGRVVLGAFVSGRGMVTVQELGPGEALGWSWLFSPYIWHFTAATREPTEVISLDAKSLRANAAEDPEFHSELLSRVAKSLYDRLLATRAQFVESRSIRP